MPGTTDDRYFEWLYSQIGATRNRNPARSYWSLARKLYTVEYVWLIPNDDNRVADGIELRHEFISEQGIDEVEKEWLELGCSVLEMFIALARRAAFESDRSPVEWFGIFLRNLGLDKLSDANWKLRSDNQVDYILEPFIYRNYAPDGTGGLFPLKGIAQDQREVELWYQLATYLIENGSY